MHEQRYLTAGDITRLLRIDKSTVYRMAEDGRLHGVKVGRQWRFPEDDVRAALGIAPHVHRPHDTIDAGRAERLARLFAELFEVMVVVADRDGRPLTPVVNPTKYMALLAAQPGVLERCVAEWADLAREPGVVPVLRQSHLGFQCARSFIRAGFELIGMVIAGGMAPAAWPPSDTELRAIADAASLDIEPLVASVDSVQPMGVERERELLAALPVLAKHLSPDFDPRSMS